MNPNSNSVNIRNAYVFIATTSFVIDLSTQYGKDLASRIIPFACEQLEAKDQEFAPLYKNLKAQNRNFVVGSSVDITPDKYVRDFTIWLEWHNVNINKNKNRKISTFSGGGEDPQSGKKTCWGAFFYFDLI